MKKELQQHIAERILNSHNPDAILTLSNALCRVSEIPGSTLPTGVWSATVFEDTVRKILRDLDRNKR
jgi:hypothetical protein